jgi:DNA (cytosine-5)-methyltransferase 1
MQGAVAPTLNSFDLGDSRTTVAVVGFNWQNGGGYKDSHDGLAITDEGVGPLSRSQVPAVAIDQVRRLTPRECERLMSWPDDWTRWEDTGAEITNGHRYKMCGNGVVSNVTEWIGARIPRG